jgi:hypothetical protein
MLPDDASCPVCLELLSFRLAGEKPHVVPVCGHSLHHACFTAVYGEPEAILAQQGSRGGEGSGRPNNAGPPGMCGVCRRPIVLGDERENKRQNSECAGQSCERFRRGRGYLAVPRLWVSIACSGRRARVMACDGGRRACCEVQLRCIFLRPESP